MVNYAKCFGHFCIVFAISFLFVVRFYSVFGNAEWKKKRRVSPKKKKKKEEEEEKRNDKKFSLFPCLVSMEENKMVETVSLGP